MKQLKMKPGVTFLLLFMWHCHCLSSGELMGTSTIRFQITNKCPFTIWPAVAPNVGHPVIAKGGFILASGKTKRIKVPTPWSGRFWARTGCNFNSSQPTCSTGDCQGLLSCNGTIGLPPATLVEVSLQPNRKGPSFYDISLVDGYNLPIAMSTKPVDANCSIQGCEKSINSLCPQALQVLSETGEVVACKSACQAFDSDFFCCRNLNGARESCSANIYSDIFKDACPSYFSYAYDTPPPLVQCSSKEYIITFCPLKSGILRAMFDVFMEALPNLAY